MKIAHRMDHHKIDWKSFRFMVFDIPTSKGDYSERYAELGAIFIHSPHPLVMHVYLARAFRDKNRFISVAPYEVCKDTAHLEKVFQNIMDQGGEGIILRDPSSPQQSGRSSGFLKHKVSGYRLVLALTTFTSFVLEISRRRGKGCWSR